MRLVQSKYNFEIISKVNFFKVKETIKSFEKYGKIIKLKSSWSPFDPLKKKLKVIIQVVQEVDVDQIKDKISQIRQNNLKQKKEIDYD